jgi:sugar/nucleoside kinase (ribokinase family)
MKHVDFLVVGHISRDLLGDSSQIGGTAVFSSRTAQALGCQTAMLTSTASDYDVDQALAGIKVHRIEAQETTTFENIYSEQGRRQRLLGVAGYLSTKDIPTSLKRPSILHLAPIANEVDPAMVHAFSNSLVGVTPQGWLRRWDEDGRVHAVQWASAAAVLPSAAAVILSLDDLPDEAMLHQFRQWARLLVLTQAEDGCTVFFGDEVRQVPAPGVIEVEPTGAGDVFAAAFLIRLHQTAGNPWEAARYANEIAAQSVTQADFEAKIAHIRAYLAQGLAQ